MSTEIHNLFPSRVVFHDCEMFEDYQSKIIDYCYEQYHNHDDDRYTLMGSNASFQHVPNHSDFPFWEYINLNLQSAMQHYGFDTNQITITAKMIVLNIGSPQSYHIAHTHGECTLSGVLWIRIPENSGKFIFHNDQTYEQCDLINHLSADTKSSNLIAPSYHYRPKEGQMVIFPPNLRHSVGSNESTEDRISIAFNIKVS
jgi:uncharacterized protein (TIGR02466 family)